MAMAEYLGDNGAKHLVLTSKRGVHNGGQQAALQELFNQGINVCPSLPMLHDSCYSIILQQGLFT